MTGCFLLLAIFGPLALGLLAFWVTGDPWMCIGVTIAGEWWLLRGRG